ncbi:MAG: YicC family protein [Acidobacteria bacterium]|nr:YicC family protein [Acidobacteriota bacterium]
MKVSSMTGFGQSELSGPDYRIACEVKTFNSRFLDISVRLPRELQFLELLVREVIREHISRGRVEASLNLQVTEGSLCRINRERVAAYKVLFESLKKDFQIDGELTFAVLLQLPGVLEVQAPSFSEDPAGLRQQIRRGVTESLESVARMRLEEGRQLGLELLERVTRAECLLEQVESLVEPAKQAYRERLWQRLQEHDEKVTLDADRINQEVVIFAERGDITEEITRMRSHLKQFRLLMGDGQGVGKQLDFLLQEMNRETNTLLSKSLHHKISESGVLLKAEVEKLREQVQNIE